MYQIFVVEDELLIRQSIRSIIEKMPGPYAFCGEASDGEMALSMMQDLMPDILLTDIRMPFLDGFGLIDNVKRMMPWLKIIIISGFGDFEFAQKAIQLGVDMYLLKPIRSAELVSAIEKIAGQIEAAKAEDALPGGYDKDELHTALRQHYMQQLLYGSAETGVLLERARALDLEVLYPCYQPVLFYFEGEDADHRLRRAAATRVLGQLKAGLYYFHDNGQLTLLACGGDPESVNDRVWEIINILRHELRELCPAITAVIGSAVQRISAVSQACRAAEGLLRKVSALSAGAVIDISDTAQLTAEIVQSDSPFGEDFQQKLQRAAPEDVPALLDAVLEDPALVNQFGSTLMRYYALIDLLRIAVSMIARATPQADPKDIASELSARFDVTAASGRRETFRQTALELLQRAARARQGRPLHLQRNHVISRAVEYVAENYCDPNITLIGVARHVGMSSAHFSTVFSQTMGKPFIAYLTGLRIERAKELLVSSDMKLSNIAMEIGYNEPNYFSHVFRKSEGMTPKEYRSLHARNGGEA